MLLHGLFLEWDEKQYKAFFVTILPGSGEERVGLVFINRCDGSHSSINFRFQFLRYLN